jgi:hypothetical protein
MRIWIIKIKKPSAGGEQLNHSSPQRGGAGVLLLGQEIFHLVLVDHLLFECVSA